MSQCRLAQLSLLAALLGFNMMPVLSGGAATAYAADAASVRPEVGKPLQTAQEDIRKGKYKDALAKIHEAEAIGGRTAYENYMIDYMRAAAAQGAGDSALAAKSYEAVLNSGHVTGAAQTKIVQALGELYYQAKEYSKAIVWLTRYLNEGGDDARMRPLLINAYYLSGDYARASKETQAQIQADEKAGRTPGDEQLQMLASCALKQNDKAGYVIALEKMLTYHPKKELWIDLLTRLENKTGFNDNRLGLDVYRLKLTVGAVRSANDFMNMAELALQAGYPSEARKIIDAAFKSGAFGSGAEASRQKRLQDLATKNAADDLKALPQTEAEVSKAKDGTGMVNAGYDYVTTGQSEKGIALMEQGIAKGGLKHPEDAKLHLALAYLQADKKSKALQALKTVQGTDGTAEIARYWTIEINHPLN
ncbi:MAG: tetratricopeptide repeat protein [Burkholderiales bacterium]